jgi:hypothetical protein
MKKTVLFTAFVVLSVVGLCCSSSKTRRKPPVIDAPLHSVGALPVQIDGTFRLVKSEVAQAGEARAYVLLGERGLFIGSLAAPSWPGLEVSEDGLHESLLKFLKDKPVQKPLTDERPLTSGTKEQALDEARKAGVLGILLEMVTPPNPERAPLLIADQNRPAADLLRVLSNVHDRGAFLAVADKNGTRQHRVFLEAHRYRMHWMPTVSVLLREHDLEISFGYQDNSSKVTDCVVPKGDTGEPDWQLLQRTLKAVGVTDNDGTIGLTAESQVSTVAEVIGILDVASVTGFPAMYPNYWGPIPDDIPPDYNPRSGATEEEHQRFDKQLLSCDDQLKVTGANVTMEDRALSGRTGYFISCYEKSLALGEASKSPLVARLRFSGDGDLAEVSFQGENGDYLEQCFSHVLKDVSFDLSTTDHTATFNLVAPAP